MHHRANFNSNELAGKYVTMKSNRDDKFKYILH